MRYRSPEDAPPNSATVPSPTKKEADAFAAKLGGVKATGNYLDPADGEITFAEYVTEWMSVQVLRTGTIYRYQRNLPNHTPPSFGHLPLSAAERTRRGTGDRGGQDPSRRNQQVGEPLLHSCLWGSDSGFCRLTRRPG